jgi:hypothetical protein
VAQGEEELTRLRRWVQWFPPLVLVFVFAGCGVYFWEAPGRDVTAFQSDSGAWIKEATIKYDVASERIYRACMKARGWQRVQVPRRCRLAPQPPRSQSATFARKALLAAAASVDPELMSRSQQVAPYADVVSATSLDELADELRRRWARNWLSDGGPTRWVSRLDRMGAKDYPVGLAPRLELIWGIRHVAVHTAGVATADFLKRHPGAVRAVGDRVQVRSPQFSAFLDAAQDFLEPTERFFLARYPSLLASTSSERVRRHSRARTHGIAREPGPSRPASP